MSSALDFIGSDRLVVFVNQCKRLNINNEILFQFLVCSKFLKDN